jgi:TonB family protein
MLTVLLESQARHQRKIGGMTLSVATHVAIIAAVTATTVRGTPVVRERIKAIPILVRPTPTPRAEQRRERAAASPSHRPAPFNPVIIAAPRIDRVPLPTWNEPSFVAPIGIGRFTVDRAPAGVGMPGGTPGPRSVVDGDGDADGGAWRGSELLMRIVTSAIPHYPAALRQAGIDGRVLVRFVVDTAGRIDPASVQVLQSTHELFTRAVRDALGGFRFKPAEVGRRRVPALAEMPFEFRITR